MANAFVPIQPISDKSSGYQNFLKWLGNVGAVTNLADSVMYRHLPDPKGRYSVKETLGALVPYERMLVDSPEKTALLKAEPLLKNATVTTTSNFPANSGSVVTTGSRAHGIPFGANVEISSKHSSVPELQHTVKHEMFGHAPTVIRAENKAFNELSGKQFVFDRKNNALYDQNMINAMSAPDASPASQKQYRDLYARNTQDIIAESNLQNDKNFSRRISDLNATQMQRAPQYIQAVPPNEQAISVYPSYMQNPNLKNQINALASKFRRVIPAIAMPVQLIDMKNLYDNINNSGMTAGYAKWLGLNTQKPGEAVY